MVTHRQEILRQRLKTIVRRKKKKRKILRLMQSALKVTTGGRLAGIRKGGTLRAKGRLSRNSLKGRG